MPDITMCADENCPLSISCYRSKQSGTRPHERQSWDHFYRPPDNHFMPECAWYIEAYDRRSNSPADDKLPPDTLAARK